MTREEKLSVNEAKAYQVKALRQNMLEVYSLIAGVYGLLETKDSFNAVTAKRLATLAMNKSHGICRELFGLEPFPV